jgi:thiamine-phosphate pyrophosphorylase
MSLSVSGLYVITDGGIPTAELRAVARAGARVLQYRDKSADAIGRRRRATALASLCRDNDLLFIVNDDPMLAVEVGADGVHLGRDDGSIDWARRLLGPDAVIGVSCYASLERAERMCAAGADYLAFGSVFPSPTKPAAPRASLDLLRAARKRFTLPLVAIGGIDAGNAATVVATGVDAVAVIAGVFHAPDPAASATRIAALFAGG